MIIYVLSCSFLCLTSKNSEVFNKLFMNMYIQEARELPVLSMFQKIKG
jgi:hypothetical protein